MSIQTKNAAMIGEHVYRALVRVERGPDDHLLRVTDCRDRESAKKSATVAARHCLGIVGENVEIEILVVHYAWTPNEYFDDESQSYVLDAYMHHVGQQSGHLPDGQFPIIWGEIKVSASDREFLDVQEANS